MAGQSNNPQTPMGGVKAFSCNSCGGQVKLLAPGQTLSAVCSHCGAVADLTDPNFKIISHWHNARPIKPLIPIGFKGTLEGKTWEVIGVVLRQAEGYDYFWQEYLLFNPYHGFRFLVNNYGNWSLVRMLVEHPEGVGHMHLKYEGQSYKRFTAGKAVVAAVMGEFYWQVSYGDKADTVDYVSPPYMLSLEAEDGGLIWSKGEYIDASEVQQAFRLEDKLPRAENIGMNRPNPHRPLAKWLGWTAGIATLIAILILLVTHGRSSREAVMEHSQMFQAPNDTIVTAPFDLKGKSGNVQLYAEVPLLDNSWFEVEGYLHNLKTMEDFGINLGLEFYSGVTDGESWSEGSRTNESVINGVPEGRYEFVGSISTEKPQMVNLRIERNVPIFSNLLLMLPLIWIFPAYFIVRSKMFEAARWAESG